MVCGHGPRCRRLCRPRPFLLALVVAVCLFCQTLTPLVTNSFLSAVVNGISPNKQSKTRQGRYKEVAASDTRCFFPISDSHTLKKIEDTVLQYFGSRTRRAILYAPPAHSKTEHQLYQRILAKHGYSVTVLENRRLVEDLRHEGPYHSSISPWDLLICLSSTKDDDTSCIQRDDLHQLELFQKVNLLPEIQYFLCSKEGLCQITKAFSVKGWSLSSTGELVVQPLGSSAIESITFADHHTSRLTYAYHLSSVHMAIYQVSIDKEYLDCCDRLDWILCSFVTACDMQLSIATPGCSSWHGLSGDNTASNITHGGKNNVKKHIAHLQYLWSQTNGAQLNQVSASSDHKDILKAQDLSVIIKAYVLVTSLTPLKAFLHSAATVWHPPKKKHFSVKLQRFFEMFFKSSSPQQAFNNMKEAISKLLLITEVLSESSASGPGSFNQCSQCFQMLTFDIGFSTSLHPIVLQVHKNFDFQDEEKSNLQDQTFKEAIFEDTFRLLLSNKSSSSSFIEALQNIYGSTVSKDGIFLKEVGQCLSLEEINSMMTFVKEVKNLGQFELLYPSAAPKIQTLLRDLYHMVDPMRRLGSVLTVHWLLFSLLEQFQFMTKETHTDLSEWRRKKSSINSSPTAMKWLQPRNSSQENVIPKQNFHFRLWKNHEALHYSSKTKEIHCSYDKDTLSHIRQIFTSPQLDLNPQFNPKIKEYYAEVPFDVVTVKIGAEPSNCQCQVHLDEMKGPSIANYPLGLGLNKIVVLVTVDSQPSPQVVSSYKIKIYREDRPSLPLFDDYMICGFVQDCGSQIHPEESCGLQPLSHEYLSAISQTALKTCEAGDAKGQWIVPCLSCSDNRTCDWREIMWQPHGCQYSVFDKPELQQCVEGRKILFIGDSTNRGMMYYLIERVNETLQEWQKTHDVKCYDNINEGKTFISYSYYPQFWMTANQRPTFEKALEQLLQRSRPLENTDQTVLIVGGVQWLNSNHLQIIQKVLNRENLSNILVIIKSIGMGFHLPVDGIHSLSQAEVQNLWNENLVILETAKTYGYEVVDTFIITMGRYKEFLRGKCGCHFHEVVKYNPSEESPHITMTLSRHYTLGKYFSSQSKLSQLQDYASNSRSPYHVQGPINQVYSEILLNRLCASKRGLVST